jgi:hypothetical protein
MCIRSNIAHSASWAAFVKSRTACAHGFRFPAARMHLLRVNTGFRERNPIPWDFKESHAID